MGVKGFPHNTHGFIVPGRELTELGFPLSVFVCGKTWTILRRVKRVNRHYKYHSLHYGETSSWTGGETGGGQGGDEQFGRHLWFTCRPPWLLQVHGPFGNSDGIGHCGSGGGLYPAFFHVYAIMQPGEKHLIALIESRYYH